MHKQDLPNFMLIGAAKAGTTSLHYYLTQHPDIYMPAEKELQFFTDQALFQKGMEFYWRQYFLGAEKFSARGEATPFYLHRPEVVIPRLQASFDQPLKFLVVLRDPVKRAWSHYQHMRRLGLEDLPFDEALQAEADRMKHQPLSWYSYFSDGLYARQLRQWFRYYPVENFLILKQRDLAEKLQLSLAHIFNFLGVDATYVIQDTSTRNEAGEARSRWLMNILMGHSGATGWLKQVFPIPIRRRFGMIFRQWNTRPVQYTSNLPESIEQSLRVAYQPDIGALESMLQVSFHEWKVAESDQAS